MIGNVSTRHPQSLSNASTLSFVLTASDGAEFIVPLRLWMGDINGTDLKSVGFASSLAQMISILFHTARPRSRHSLHLLQAASIIHFFRCYVYHFHYQILLTNFQSSHFLPHNTYHFEHGTPTVSPWQSWPQLPARSVRSHRYATRVRSTLGN